MNHGGMGLHGGSACTRASCRPSLRQGLAVQPGRGPGTCRKGTATMPASLWRTPGCPTGFPGTRCPHTRNCARRAWLPPPGMPTRTRSRTPSGRVSGPGPSAKLLPSTCLHKAVPAQAHVNTELLFQFPVHVGRFGPCSCEWSENLASGPQEWGTPWFSVPFSGWCCGSGSASPAPTRPTPRSRPGCSGAAGPTPFSTGGGANSDPQGSPRRTRSPTRRRPGRGRASPPLPVEDVDNRAAVFRHLRPHGPEVAGGRDFRAVGHPQTAFVSGMASSPPQAPALHRAVDAHTACIIERSRDPFPGSGRRRPFALTVESPAHHFAIAAQRAGVIRTGGKGCELATGRRHRAGVGAPALEFAVQEKPAGVVGATADRLEFLVRWLVIIIDQSPADDLIVGSDGTGMKIAITKRPECAGGRYRLVMEVLSPAVDAATGCQPTGMRIPGDEVNIPPRRRFGDATPAVHGGIVAQCAGKVMADLYPAVDTGRSFALAVFKSLPAGCRPIGADRAGPKSSDIHRQRMDRKIQCSGCGFCRRCLARGLAQGTWSSIVRVWLLEHGHGVLD